MKNATELTLHGHSYIISAHPFMEGGVIAFELNRDIRAHVIRSQKVTMDALDALSAEDTKRLEEAKDDAERGKIWAELVVPKLKKSELVASTADFLSTLEPERMMSLFKRMVKHTTANGKSLGDPSQFELHLSGNYKVVVPLMAAIIEHNDFLDLDASELLQIQAQA